MVLDPIPQSLPVPFFGSRPQPPTSHAKPSNLKERHTRIFLSVCLSFFLSFYVYIHASTSVYHCHTISMLSPILCLYVCHSISKIEQASINPIFNTVYMYVIPYPKCDRPQYLRDIVCVKNMNAKPLNLKE